MFCSAPVAENFVSEAETQLAHPPAALTLFYICISKGQTDKNKIFKDKYIMSIGDFEIIKTASIPLWVYFHLLFFFSLVCL